MVVRFLLLCLFLGHISARDEYSSVHISTPATLAAKFPHGVFNKPAMFGAPMQIDFHKKSLSGPVVYVPADDLDACKPINKTEFLALHALQNLQDWIVMVDRGSCDFVLKVRHVQEVGAKAAIIVDNVQENDYYLPYMADDGNGKSITIPSVLIRKKDGKTISEFLLSATPVIMELAWNIPSPDNNVEWELWTTSTDRSDNFKRHFDEVEKVFGNATLFTPHYMIESPNYCFKPNATTEDQLPCKTDCTNNGRYCMHSTSSWTGQAALQEDLRQICLWQTVNGTEDEIIWWDYVEEWQDACLSKKNITKECSEEVINKKNGHGLVKVKVQACVQASQGAELLGSKNNVFEAELAAKKERNIVIIPQVLINGMPYFGGLQCPSPPDLRSCKVLQMLCMGFKNSENISACNTESGCNLGQKRDVCHVCGGAGTYDACGLCLQPGDRITNKSCSGCDKIPNSGVVTDVCGICGGPGRDACQQCTPNPILDASDCYAVVTESGGLPTWGVILIILACVVAVAVGVFFFMQHRQNALRQDIDALMKQYLPLEPQQNT